MRVRVHVYQIDGRTRVSLVDESFLPFYPLCIHLDRECGGKSINSKKSVAQDLRFFCEWLHIQSIDIEDRIVSGRMLTPQEIAAFTQAAKFSFSSITESKSVNISRLSNKVINNLIHSTKVVNSLVLPPTTNNRIRRALAFIESIYNDTHYIGHTPDFVGECYDRMKILMLNGIRRDTKLRLSNLDPEESVIPDGVFHRMLDIIQPENPSNPFKHSKWRNALIIMLLINTGERKSAILKLKISDCDFTGSCSKINIRRTPDDLSDIRKNKPSQKTLEHSTYVDKEIMLELKSYIDNKRKSYLFSQTHEFVFVSEMPTKGKAGSPLSISSIQYIFSVLSRSLNFNLTPHTLRHKWNELYSDIVDKDSDYSDSFKDKVRRKQMGWSGNSKMPFLYNKYKIIKKSQEYQLKMQTEMMETYKHD